MLAFGVFKEVPKLCHNSTLLLSFKNPQNYYPHQEPPQETFKTSPFPDHPTQPSPWCLASGIKMVFAAPFCKLYLSREQTATGEVCKDRELL